MKLWCVLRRKTWIVPLSRLTCWRSMPDKSACPRPSRPDSAIKSAVSSAPCPFADWRGGQPRWTRIASWSASFGSDWNDDGRLCHPLDCEESLHHSPQARRISQRRKSGYLPCWPLGRHIAPAIAHNRPCESWRAVGENLSANRPAAARRRAGCCRLCFSRRSVSQGIFPCGFRASGGQDRGRWRRGLGGGPAACDGRARGHRFQASGGFVCPCA